MQATTTNEVSNKFDAVKNRAINKAENFADQAKSKLAETSNYANEAIQKTKENVEHLADSVKSQVKYNPLIALGVTAVCGIILGALFSKN